MSENVCIVFISLVFTNMQSTCVYVCVYACFHMCGGTHKWTYVCAPWMGRPKVDFRNAPWVIFGTHSGRLSQIQRYPAWPVSLATSLSGSCPAFWGWTAGGSHACAAFVELPGTWTLVLILAQQVLNQGSKFKPKGNPPHQSNSFLCDGSQYGQGPCYADQCSHGWPWVTVHWYVWK